MMLQADSRMALNEMYRFTSTDGWNACKVRSAMTLRDLRDSILRAIVFVEGKIEVVRKELDQMLEELSRLVATGPRETCADGFPTLPTRANWSRLTIGHDVAKNVIEVIEESWDFHDYFSSDGNFDDPTVAKADYGPERSGNVSGDDDDAKPQRAQSSDESSTYLSEPDVEDGGDDWEDSLVCVESIAGENRPSPPSMATTIPDRRCQRRKTSSSSTTSLEDHSTRRIPFDAADTPSSTPRRNLLRGG